MDTSATKVQVQVRGRGLAAKFLVAILATLVLLFALTGYVTNRLEARALDDLLGGATRVVSALSDEQVAASRNAVDLKAHHLARMLAEIAPAPIAELNLSALLNYAQVATEDPDISYVEFRNNGGKVLARAGDRNGADGNVEQPISHEGQKMGQVLVNFNYRRAGEQIATTRQKSEGIIADMTATRSRALEVSTVALAITLLVMIAISALLISHLVRRHIKGPLDKVVLAARRIAAGDLTAQVDHRSSDEIGQLAASFNDMASRFRAVVEQISSSASAVSNESGQLAAITVQTSRGMNDQERETHQVAAAMHEMSATVQEVARSTNAAAQAATQADSEAKSGGAVVKQAIDAIMALAAEVERTAEVIRRVETESTGISNVLEVIRTIAEQTNLLALNAAIEAARAGEQGRGFAVVADEVRSLANRTQQSTEEIRRSIEQLQSGSKAAVESMEQGRVRAKLSVDEARRAGDSLSNIVRVVATISEMTAQIASAAEQQSSVAQEISQNVERISRVAQETTGGARQLAQSGDTLAQQSSQLQSLVAQFRIVA